MYEVYECEKPACTEGFPDLTMEDWANNRFETLEEANNYVRDWLGNYKEGLDHELEVDEPYYYGGSTDYVVIHYVEDVPKLLRKEIEKLEEKKEKLLKAERIARILESITIPKELSGYPELYDAWHGYRGRLQINGFTNLKTQFPPIIAEFAKAGYKVKKFTDNPQSALRTYYLCLREDENVEDIYISAYLAVNTSQCHYVQIGTRVKEEPVYELRCDDADDLPKSSPGKPMESDLSSGEQREPESSEQGGTECGDSTD